MRALKSKTVIVNYHRLRPASEGGASPRSSVEFYSVSATCFSEQLRFLYEHDFRTILIDEFLTSESASDRSLILTFDDGNESDLAEAVPVLCKFGFKATFFVCLQYVGKPGYLSWRQIEGLLQAGMSVQSHGLLHRDLTQLPTTQIVDELGAARVCLERNLGTTINYVSIPGGFVDRRVCLAALQAGHKSVCTSTPGIARSGHVLNRFAIRHSTSLNEFRQIAMRNSLGIRRAAYRYESLRLLKRLIGVERYEYLKVRLWP